MRYQGINIKLLITSFSAALLIFFTASAGAGVISSNFVRSSPYRLLLFFFLCGRSAGGDIPELLLLSLLLFSGLGSLASQRLPGRVVLLSLVLVPAACALLLAPWLQLTIGWSLAGRLLVTVCTLAPIGLLLGVPMADGIRLLQEKAPERVPWAWAVNGCASVISSILAVLGAVSLGSMAVLTAGAAAYALAWQEAGAICTADRLTAV